MLINKQQVLRIVIGVVLILAALMLGAASLLGAYDGSPEPWTTYLSCAVFFTFGVYLIKSAN